MTLVADIGGTNARFGLAEQDGETYVLSAIERYQTGDFSGIHGAIETYLKTVNGRPNKACFAVAAPIYGGEINFTHNHWDFGIAALEQALGLDTLQVFNDFEALAAGIAHLPDRYFETIKDGAGLPDAPRLVIGPGTGLGQALLVPTSSGLKVISTQGGHVGFAPRTDFEVEVFNATKQALGRVTAERLLSGAGMVNLYQAVCAVTSHSPRFNGPGDITRAEDETCVQTVELFCAILGAVVGDAVLATGARGGVYLAGGILPKIKDVFLRSAFLDALIDKDPMQDYVSEVPITLIVEDGAALYGAAALLDD